MKKIRSISLVILIAFSCVSCAASGDVGKVNYIESGAVDIADYMDYRLTGYSENEILVKIAYDYINPDYSVYTAEYFGDGFEDCTVYDLYGDYALYLILTLKNSGIDILEKSIRSLNQREDVMLAEKNYGDNTQGLTEYTPEQHGVKLFNRRSPYTDEFQSFNYDRQYRLLYYSCSVMYGILSEQERSQWLEIYNENDMYSVEPQEPALITFIEYFDISQEEFDAEIERIKAEREMQGDSFDYYTEAGELPDSDIIYTFDNDVIKEYCKYE
ncbi:MAG: hypothetical protein LUG85_06070 [Clostridiales bacterium]|nr:hypothetical protein [Clostridiales bacterium]